MSLSLGKLILLLEDSEDDALLVTRLFERLGIANPIFVVSEGDEAIAYLSGQGRYADRKKFPLPTVFLVDLKLPGTSGLEVLKWCREQSQPWSKSLLKIALSGHEDLRLVNGAYANGAHSFLLKPITEQELSNLLQTFTGYWDYAPGRQPTRSEDRRDVL